VVAAPSTRFSRLPLDRRVYIEWRVVGAGFAPWFSSSGFLAARLPNEAHEAWVAGPKTASRSIRQTKPTSNCADYTGARLTTKINRTKPNQVSPSGSHGEQSPFLRNEANCQNGSHICLILQGVMKNGPRDRSVELTSIWAGRTDRGEWEARVPIGRVDSTTIRVVKQLYC
jgi:hypothetical protein